MNKKLLYLICLLSISFANAQLTTLAIVGSGTTQGWPNDPQTDAHQLTTTDNENWTISDIALMNGAVKFRGNNSWALPYNWGGTTFPNGTATVDGPGITTTPGFYDVSFNSTTGVYSFVLQTSTFPVMGLVGTATSGGWDTDTDMATLDGINYFIDGVDLVPGAIKFRQDHTWTPTTNWGGDTFPSGTGIVDGPAITVLTAGTYNVTFNKNTLAYNFFFPTIAIVGPATAQGWPNDPQTDLHQLTTIDGITYTLASIDLTTGPAKFRANNSWAQNWGTNSFPDGTAVQDGQDIPVTAGTYGITFNKDTGTFSFGAPLAVTSFTAIGFKVYPNPTASDWNFTATEMINEITIADLTGKIVMTVSPAANTATVNASGIGSGIYFALISTSSSLKTVKVIKQ